MLCRLTAEDCEVEELMPTEELEMDLLHLSVSDDDEDKGGFYHRQMG